MWPAAMFGPDWTIDEEALLDSLVVQQGPRWRLLARHFPGRSEDVIRHQYRRTHGPPGPTPRVSNTGVRFKRFTEEEDTRIAKLFLACGGDWTAVASSLGRKDATPKSVRSRLMRCVRNRNPFLAHVLLVTSKDVGLVVTMLP